MLDTPVPTSFSKTYPSSYNSANLPAVSVREMLQLALYVGWIQMATRPTLSTVVNAQPPALLATSILEPTIPAMLATLPAYFAQG